MYKKTKYPLEGVVNHNTLRRLFLLFSFFIFHYSLQAREALPVLVAEGEVFTSNKDFNKNFYIDKQSPINAVAISQDGATIVSGSDDNIIKVWDRTTGKLLKILEGHIKKVDSVAISKDGSIIVSGSWDTSIKIWDREQGKLLKTLEGHTHYVTSVSISADGATIVSGSLDKSIKIWETKSGRLLKSLEGHKYSVTSVVISEDGTKIISGSWDDSIKIWEIKTGKLLKTLEGHIAVVGSVGISEDGAIIVSASIDSSIKIWETKSGKLLKTLKGNSGSVSISKDGSTIVSGSWDNSIKIWETKSGQLLKTLEGHSNEINSVGISKDGSIIVSGSIDSSIKIWETKSGKLLKILEGHIGSVSSVSISKDGTFIVSGSVDNSIKIWETKSGQLLKTLEGHEGSVTSVAISEDGTIIVSGSIDNSIKIWEIKSGKLLKTLEGHQHWIRSVLISKDGSTIISGSDDNSIKIWNLKSGKLLKSLKGLNKFSVTSVAISEDGETLVSASDDSIKIWSLKLGIRLKTLGGHQHFVRSVAISKDGNIVVSGSDDNSIKIWETKSGKLLKTLEGHTSSVTSVAISQDGATIVSASSDNSIKIWNSRSGKLMKECMGGVRGNWLVKVLDFSPKFFRGDDGTFLMKKELYKEGKSSLNELSPAYRSDYNLSKKDELTVIVSSKKREMLNRRSMKLTLNIKNNGQSSYAIQAHSRSEHFTIEQNFLSVINQGEHKKLILTVHSKLARKNPEPLKQEEFNLTILTGNGSKFNVSVPISVPFASVLVAKAEESEDEKTLNIELKNSGNEKIEKATVRLLGAFDKNITQSIVNLEPNATVTVPFSTKGFDFKKNKKVEVLVSIANEEEILKNPSGTKIAPAYVWHSKPVIIVLNKMAWYLYALMALGIAVLSWLIWYFKRYKNTLVLKLQNNPKELLTLSPKLLTEAQTKLSTINQWQTILESADVSQKNVDETLEFFNNTQEEKAKHFCQKIGATYSKEHLFYRIYLPKSFTLNMNTFLLYITDALVKEIEKKSIDQDDKVLILGKEEHQKELYKLASDKTNRLIAPRPEKLTEFLLSSQSEQVLIGIFSESLLFKDISPYQVNSGVTNEANFFGQIEIIRDIVTKENINYLIVGARQLGKSSIIKALERRYVGSSKVDCYSFTMDDENIVLAMSTALGLSSTTTLEEIITAISNAPKKCLFLIDESDKFIKHEKENDYRITEAFRKLSQEAKATFVMTGFWTLYFYVTSDYHSPLKNFGELIKLEGLDHDACRELMTKPMERIGVSYEDEDVIENVIKLCGQRPNLIAITCNEVLKKLEGKVISQADIDEVVENSSLEDYLKGWGSMSEKEMDNRLDRVIVYLTLEKESFRLADVDAMLKEQGKQIDANWIKSSLERLVVGYILEERKKNYAYRVPLFKQKLLEDDIEILLDGDMEGL